MCAGDFPLLRASGTGLDHALQWILPKWGKATAACSSAVRFGEIPPVWVSEDQGLPIAHDSDVALTRTFVLGGAR
jgi:hypothetical protein